MTAGYWQTNYWCTNYWHEDYWQDYAFVELVREIVNLYSYILTSLVKNSILCKSVSKDSLIDLEII